MTALNPARPHPTFGGSRGLSGAPAHGLQCGRAACVDGNQARVELRRLSCNVARWRDKGRLGMLLSLLESRAILSVLVCTIGFWLPHLGSELWPGGLQLVPTR